MIEDLNNTSRPEISGRDILKENEIKEAPPKFTSTEMTIIKKKAKREIPILVDAYASKMGVSYGSIHIRTQRTLWGSCTSDGNLNFNCLLILLPERVMRYVVVHELCHRKEMNQSKQFWAEVEKIIPDYKEIKKELDEKGSILMQRL